MTIHAKLAGTPGGGHGLTDDILEAIWGELAKGKQPGVIPALVMLQPSQIGLGVKKKNRSVTFEVVRLEPVTVGEEATRVQLAIREAYDARHADNGQGALELDEEDARRYLAYLEEWRKAVPLTIKALGEQWREHFPPDNGVPGDYRKASGAHLLEFCLSKGILPDESAAASTVVPIRGGDAK